MRRIFLLLLLAESACSLFYDTETLGPGDSTDASAADAADIDATVEAGPRPYCTQPLNPMPAFCADFDEGDIKKNWANEGLDPDPSETAGNTIVPDDAGMDGTRAVAADFLAKGPGETPGEAVLLKTFSVIREGATVLLRMDVRFDTKPPMTAQGPGVVVFTLGPSGSLGGVILLRAVGGDVLAVYEGRTPGAYVQFPSLPSKQWMELRFQIDIGGFSSAGSCSVDGGAEAGADAGDGGNAPGATLLVNGTVRACVPLPASFAKATSAILTIGAASGLAPVEAMHVAFDNVAIYF